jgi:hypothetical protein
MSNHNGSYRKHHISKRTRIAHHKRFQKRKKKMGGLAAFAYISDIGKNKNKLGNGMGLLH